MVFAKLRSSRGSLPGRARHRFEKTALWQYLVGSPVCFAGVRNVVVSHGAFRLLVQV